jgi:hypothetical protein
MFNYRFQLPLLHQELVLLTLDIIPTLITVLVSYNATGVCQLENHVAMKPSGVSH